MRGVSQVSAAINLDTGKDSESKSRIVADLSPPWARWGRVISRVVVKSWAICPLPVLNGALLKAPFPSLPHPSSPPSPDRLLGLLPTIPDQGVFPVEAPSNDPARFQPHSSSFLASRAFLGMIVNYVARMFQAAASRLTDAISFFYGSK